MNQKTGTGKEDHSIQFQQLFSVWRMAFSHKELDVDAVNGIYTRSVYTEVRMGDTGKMSFLGFFFNSWMTGEKVFYQCLSYPVKVLHRC